MVPPLRKTDFPVCTGVGRYCLINRVTLYLLYRAGIDDVETDVVEIEAKLDKVSTTLI